MKFCGGLTGSETRAMMDLLQRVREGGTTILYVEHDMKAIMSVCDRITVAEFRPEAGGGQAGRHSERPVSD